MHGPRLPLRPKSHQQQAKQATNSDNQQSLPQGLASMRAKQAQHATAMPSGQENALFPSQLGSTTYMHASAAEQQPHASIDAVHAQHHQQSFAASDGVHAQHPQPPTQHSQPPAPDLQQPGGLHAGALLTSFRTDHLRPAANPMASQAHDLNGAVQRSLLGDERAASDAGPMPDAAHHSERPPRLGEAPSLQVH